MEQNQERDLVVMQDDEGHELTMEVLDYFYYEGEEYAILVEDQEGECECEHEHGEECDCCGEQTEAYIMHVVPVGDDQEEFVPVEEDLLEKLIDFVENDLYEECDDECDEEEFGEAEDPETK